MHTPSLGYQTPPFGGGKGQLIQPSISKSSSPL